MGNVSEHLGELVSEIVDREAAEIGDLYRGAKNAMVDGVYNLLAAGERLATKKSQLNRGEWLPWLAENEKALGFGDRTAQLLLKAHNQWGTNPQLTSDLTEDEATQICRLIWGNKPASEDTGDGASSGGASASAQSPAWDDSQLERKARVEAGECVVANMRTGADEALIAWAQANECFVRIDRTTDWGNPFEMPDDGDRAEVVAKFSKFYFPHKDGLLDRTPTMCGKVLGCWCYPEECHGDVIAEVVNREANGEGDAGKIADEIAEIDG
jgi:uncharacterized protein DUF4326/DUF3102 family protein